MHETEGGRSTRELLEQFHGGDPSALARLMQLHYPWLREQVHRKLNTNLRRDGDTNDYLNTLAVNVLERGPRFVVSDEQHFRRLLLVMVRNVLADGGRRLHAKKRDIGRERRLPTQVTVLYLDGDPPRGTRQPPTPGDQAIEAEHIELARLAMQLIPPAERRVIEMQQNEDLTFAAIGEREGVTAEAARKRFHNGLRRLRLVLDHLRQHDTMMAIRKAGLSDERE